VRCVRLTDEHEEILAKVIQALISPSRILITITGDFVKRGLHKNNNKPKVLLTIK